MSVANRLGTALWAGAGPGELRRSIRISRATGRAFVDDYRLLLDALGSIDEPLLAGWWTGWAGEITPLMPNSADEVSLLPVSDLEWLVWPATWDGVVKVMETSGLEPTLLASAERRWVLISPPSSDEMFLYPEVSAWGE